MEKDILFPDPPACDMVQNPMASNVGNLGMTQI